MSEFLELMAAPFAACMVIAAIHAYLGLHVVERGVIFVDLALAQVAAFGATVGFLWGFGLHSTEGYLLALGATFIGAAVIAVTRLRKPVIPQEALIGIVYVVAAAASILVLSRAPEGGEELKALLVGHLLFVGWAEVATITVVYAVIGILHWFIRKPLLAISKDPEQAFADGLHVKWWDFLFYVTFGIVVTASVELVGVLLVFSFLIVPTACGVLLAQRTGMRLLIAWCAAIVTSALGIAASFFWDLPTGAAVVCGFGICFAFCSFLRAVLKRG